MTMASPSRPFLGAAYVVFGMSLIGLIDNYVKILAQEAGMWQFHLFRSAVVCVILLVIAFAKGWSVLPKDWWTVVWRSLFASTAMVIYFGALALVPIAEAAAGLFTAPIFVLIFSVMFFGGRVGVWRIGAVVLGFSGVLLVLQPDIYNLNPFLVVPILAGACWGTAALLTRERCRDESLLTLLFGFFGALGIWGIIGLFVFSFFNTPTWGSEAAPFVTQGWVWPSQIFLFYVMVQALGSIIGVGCLVQGYKLADAALVTVFEYSFLISAGFWEWYLWGETLNNLAYVGVAGIMLSGAVIAIRSQDS